MKELNSHSPKRHWKEASLGGADIQPTKIIQEYKNKEYQKEDK